MLESGHVNLSMLHKVMAYSHTEISQFMSVKD